MQMSKRCQSICWMISLFKSMLHFDHPRSLEQVAHPLNNSTIRIENLLVSCDKSNSTRRIHLKNDHSIALILSKLKTIKGFSDLSNSYWTNSKIHRITTQILPHRIPEKSSTGSFQIIQHWAIRISFNPTFQRKIPINKLQTPILIKQLRIYII